MTGTYPERLTSLHQWVVCDDDKIPLNPKTLRRADSTNPATWADYATACRVAAQRGLYLGFVLANGIAGVDLDKCRNAETGEIEPWALAIVRRLNTLTEVSRSDTGLHLLAECDGLPEGGRRRGQIEMYETGRFFLMTGNTLAGYDTLAERTDELAALHREIFTKPTPPRSPRPSPSTPPIDRDTETILAAILKTTKGRRLFSGDMSSYESHSHADQALCNLFVAAGADRAQADDLFRRSALLRDKWDQRRGDRTYGEMTLDKAFDGSVHLWETVTPSAPPSETCTDCDTDPCGDLQRENLRLRAELDQVRAERDDLQQTVDTLRVRVQIADQQLATHRNKHLGAAKAVGASLIQVFAANTPAKPNDPAGYRVPLAKLADLTGLSEDACSRQVKQLAKYTLPETNTPVVYVDVVNVGGLDHETGELVAPHKELWVGPGVSPKAFGDLIATFDPGAEAKPKWGGRSDRGTCADHPDDGVIERVRYQKVVTYECAICNQVLEERVTPVGGRVKVQKLAHIPTPQDAAMLPTVGDATSLIPQDAGTIGTPENVVRNYPGKMRHKGDLQTQPLFTGPTAEEMAAGLAAWSHGRAPTPVDPHTDVTIGGKR